MRRFLIALLLTVLTFCCSTPEVLAAQNTEKATTKLENKVSKKFSKTFCNSTGFGISNEGALKFALGETKSEFSKNPLVGQVNLETIKDKILVDIADTCYYFDLSKNDLDELVLEKSQ